MGRRDAGRERESAPLIDPDARFFQQHPDRKTHIREPGRTLAIDKQRAVRYVSECEGEFWSLGYHDKSRRRIILTRVGFDGSPLPENRILKIPFLAFSDETIEDRDDVLLPLLAGLMADQVEKMR